MRAADPFNLERFVMAQAVPTSGAENRPLAVRFRHSCAARRQPAAANSEAALPPLG